MIKAKFSPIPSDLCDFYHKIFWQQSAAHGLAYMRVHGEISTRIHQLNKPVAYRELGVNQGATAACAIMAGASQVELIDHKLCNFEPFRHLFQQYADENNIELTIREQSSLSLAVDPHAHITYIDTLHSAHHLMQELMIYSRITDDYIICHDTQSRPSLKRAILEFVAKNPQWRIVQHCSAGVGFTTIGFLK